MALLRNQQLKLLSPEVTRVTLGQPFISWAETTAQRIVESASNGKEVVNLEQILRAKNIHLHETYESRLKTSCKGHVINKDSHYDLFIDLSKIQTEHEKKFVIAHEIAHTLFYDRREGGFSKEITLSFGAKQIEDICDFIAICILLPKSFIQNEISQYKDTRITLRQRNENYLKFVFHLAAKYQVDSYYVLYRLISNLSFLPNTLCLGFVETDKWYLRLVYQTDSLSERNLYIPRESKSNNRFISAKKSFIEILERIANESKLIPNRYGSLIIDKSHFDSYYQGNLKQFLARHFTHKLNVLKVYYRVNSDRSILTFFPFDGLIGN